MLGCPRNRVNINRLSQNPYIYCQNDPVNNSDPTGLRPDKYGGYGDNPTGAQQAEANKAANAAKKKAQQKAKDDDVRRLTVKDPSARVVLDADFAAAAQSTVYGAGKWISVNRPDHMGPGTWSLLGGYENRYGKNGPAKVDFSEVSVRERWASKPVLRDHGQVDLSAAAYAQYLVQVEGMSMPQAYQLAWEVWESNDLTALGHGAVALRGSQRGMTDEEKAYAGLAFSRGWSAEWREDGERLDAFAGVLACGASYLSAKSAVLGVLTVWSVESAPVATPILAGLTALNGLGAAAFGWFYGQVTDTRVERGYIPETDQRLSDEAGVLNAFANGSGAAGVVNSVSTAVAGGVGPWGITFGIVSWATSLPMVYYELSAY